MNSSHHESIKLPMFRLNPIVPDKNQKYLVYTLAAYTFVLLATLICMLYQNHNTGLSTSQTNLRSTKILTELNSVRYQLQKISLDQNPENLKASVATLNTELSGIEKTLTDTAKKPDVEKINQHLAALQSGFNDLTNTISSQFNQKKYLNNKALPFQVSYLDMISGQPFVSVNFEHHVIPLGIGDKLNGWTMTAADYAGQSVEFTNGQGQFIKVTLAS